MREFSDFCHDLIRSQTLSEVADAFRAAVLEEGFTVSLCPVISAGVRPARVQWLFRNLTPAWEKYSDQKQIPVRSPAMIAARKRSSPFTFVEVFDNPRLPKDQRWVWQTTREWGWLNGFVVPVHGPGEYFSYVSMASPERDLNLGFENRARLQMLALLAHDRCHALSQASLEAPIISDEADQLSGRELECMRWVAAGKTDWEIGMILAISSSTVRFHVENARRKLEASSRPQAVARLFSLGLL